MRKKDAVSDISEKLSVNLSRAEEIYNFIISQLIEQLGKGNRVTLSSFGSFQVVMRHSKLGVNPRNGEKLQIPQHLSVKFKMSRKLGQSINGTVKDSI